MKMKTLFLASLLLSVVGASLAFAQSATPRVVTTCGAMAPFSSQNVGTNGTPTVDANGNLCGSGGGGGGGNVNVTGINGVTPLVGAGATGTGSLRTTQSQDTATVAGAAPTTTGIYVTGPSAAALATSANQSSVIGTKAAGTAATNSLLNGCVYNSSPPAPTTGQQVASQCSSAGSAKTLDDNSAALLAAAQAGTGSTGAAVPSSAIYAGMNVGGNLTGMTGTANGLKVDASATTQPVSQSGTWTTQMGTTPACGSVIAISQTASTDLHTASGKTYICSIIIVSPDAEVVSLVEGTGSTCATGVAALLGATTAANGMSFAANGGFTSTSAAPWLAMQTTSDHLCLLQSGSGRIAGVITYNDH